MPRAAAKQPLLNELHERDLASDPDYLAEDLALDVTEDISRIMQFRGLSRSDLARGMNVNRSYITKMLKAPPNMTLRTIALAGIALGVRSRIVFEVDTRPTDGACESPEALFAPEERKSQDISPRPAPVLTPG
jgi:transcriptional regulator with XRE-family HTH domain